MANYKSGAERRNDRMNKIFDTYKANLKDPSIKSFKRHQRKIGVATKDRGVDYPGSHEKALSKMK